MYRKRIALVVLVPAVLVLAFYAAGRERSRAATQPAGAATAGRTTELTIYSQDFALVHEKRPVSVAKGASTLTLPDVSREMDPESVLLRWEGSKEEGLRLIGHSYDLGVTNSQGLLKQELGKPVELIRYGDNGRVAERTEGRLLVAEGGQPAVVEADGKLYVNPPGTVVVAADGAPTIPQLTVQVESDAARQATLDVAYLSRGIKWSADYVATLSQDAEDRLDLECYATVTNRTGVAYPDASVTLAAGAPNRAARPAAQRAWMHQAQEHFIITEARDELFVDGRVKARNGLEYGQVSAPQAAADLYAYPLKRPASIQSEQLTRLLMMRREGVDAKKEYTYRTPSLYAWDSPQQERGPVAVALSFVNTEEEAMGVPLPQGALRVYDPDSAGRLRYAGAASVPATPKGKAIHVTLSNAFDVIARYTTVSSKQVGKHTCRKQVRVLLTNQRARPVEVRVVQGFWGGWKITAESDPHKKPTSSTAQWTVPVPAGGAKTVSFTVELAV